MSGQPRRAMGSQQAAKARGKCTWWSGRGKQNQSAGYLVSSEKGGERVTKKDGEDRLVKEQGRHVLVILSLCNAVNLMSCHPLSHLQALPAAQHSHGQIQRAARAAMRRR